MAIGRVLWKLYTMEAEQKGLKLIKKHKSTHQKDFVYVVDNEVIALLFASNENCNGDYDTFIGFEEEIPFIVERWPGIPDKIYSSEASLYKLDGENFNHYHYLWEPEVISFFDEPVLEECEIENVLEKLRMFQNEGRLRIFFYPNRPDFIPVDNSDLIEQAKLFETMGFKGAEEQLYKLYPQLKNSPVISISIQ